MENKVNLVVLLDEAHQTDVPQVAKALEDQGLEVTETFEAIGVIIGAAPSERVPDLVNVDGVATIEEEQVDYHTSEYTD
jgi:methylmalonyl-CoA mutase cobalamin-binding subunit